MTAEKETVGFEWSECGLRLLSRVHNLLDKNGGAVRYADMVESEWVKEYMPHRLEYEHRAPKLEFWTDDEMRILFENQHLRARAVALLLPCRTEIAVQQKWFKLIESGFIKRKKRVNV